jgi:hypothetical protein
LFAKRDLQELMETVSQLLSCPFSSSKNSTVPALEKFQIEIINKRIICLDIPDGLDWINQPKVDRM